MRKAAIILAAVLTLPVSVAGAQEKGATPQDVVHKVKRLYSGFGVVDTGLKSQS